MDPPSEKFPPKVRLRRKLFVIRKDLTRRKLPALSHPDLDHSVALKYATPKVAYFIPRHVPDPLNELVLEALVLVADLVR